MKMTEFNYPGSVHNYLKIIFAHVLKLRLYDFFDVSRKLKKSGFEF